MTGKAAGDGGKSPKRWNLPSLLGSPAKNALGDVWGSLTASKAFRNGSMRSLMKEGAHEVRIAVRNATSLPLIMCWVNGSSEPHHFYTIEPLGSTSMGTGANTNTRAPVLNENRQGVVAVTDQDSIEHSTIGHSFCFATEFELDNNGGKILAPNKVIGGYRSSCLSPGVATSETSFHLITITTAEEHPEISTSSACCAPWNLRTKKKRARLNDNRQGSNINDKDVQWCLSVQKAAVDPTPYDTSNKHYDSDIVGGWPLHLEPNWHEGDNDLKESLQKDMEALCRFLPQHAQEELVKDTPLWVNKSLVYGPKACPIRPHSCCFHPNGEWLRENGMTPEKEQCVELYRASNYKHDRLWWGVGGVMLHEYSHAYHFKCLEDGYDNKEIWDCYRKAMKEKLYDCVQVHGPDEDETTAKAYACTDAMEYFAELSTAFLGGLGDEEYNKWYPFNRKQLKEHDPRAYKLLQRLWKVNESELDDSK